MGQKFKIYLDHDIKEITLKLNFLKAYLDGKNKINKSPEYFINVIDSCSVILENYRTKESLMLFQYLKTIKNGSKRKSAQSKVTEISKKIISNLPIRVALLDNDDFILQNSPEVMSDVIVEVFKDPDSLFKKIQEGDKYDCFICDKNFGLYSIEATPLFHQLKRIDSLKLLITHEELDPEEMEEYKMVFDYVAEKELCKFSDILKSLRQ